MGSTCSVCWSPTPTGTVFIPKGMWNHSYGSMEHVAVGLHFWASQPCAFLGCIATMKVSYRLRDNEFTLTEPQSTTRRASTTPDTLPPFTTFYARAHSTIDSQGNTFEFQSFHTYYTQRCLINAILASQFFFHVIMTLHSTCHSTKPQRCVFRVIMYHMSCFCSYHVYNYTCSQH